MAGRRRGSGRGRAGMVGSGSSSPSVAQLQQQQRQQQQQQQQQAGEDPSSPSVQDGMSIVARQLSEPVKECMLQYQLEEDAHSKHKPQGTIRFRVKLFAIGASTVSTLTVNSAAKRNVSLQSQ
jgi:hypothetical protein